jgi:hypothetical protein
MILGHVRGVFGVSGDGWVWRFHPVDKGVERGGTFHPLGGQNDGESYEKGQVADFYREMEIMGRGGTFHPFHPFHPYAL